MTTFIKSSSVKTKSEKINKTKIDTFISKFNKYIKKGGDSKTDDDAFRLNDILDKMPSLNNSEFEHAVLLAKQAGWKLTQHPDNYQSTTYTMTKIK